MPKGEPSEENSLVFRAPDLYYIFTFDLMEVAKNPKVSELDLDSLGMRLHELDVPFYSVNIPQVRHAVSLIERDRSFSGKDFAASLSAILGTKLTWRGFVELRGKTKLLTSSDLNLILLYLLCNKTADLEQLIIETISKLTDAFTMCLRLLSSIEGDELDLRKDHSRSKDYVLGEMTRRFTNLAKSMCYIPDGTATKDVLASLQKKEFHLGNAREHVRLVEMAADFQNPKMLPKAIAYFRALESFVFEASVLVGRMVSLYYLNVPIPPVENMERLNTVEKMVELYAKRITYFRSIGREGRKHEQAFTEEFATKYVPLRIVPSSMEQNIVRLSEAELELVNAIGEVCAQTRRKTATVTEVNQFVEGSEWRVAAALEGLASKNIITRVRSKGKDASYTTIKGFQYVSRLEGEEYWEVLRIGSDKVEVFSPEVRISEAGIVSIRLRARPRTRDMDLADISRLESKLSGRMVRIATSVWRTFAVCWNDCFERDEEGRIPFALESGIRIAKTGTVYRRDGDAYREVIYHRFVIRLFMDERLFLDADPYSEKNKQVVGLARSAATAWRDYRPSFVQRVIENDISNSTTELILLTEKGLLLNMPLAAESEQYRGFMQDLILTVELLGMREVMLARIDAEIDALLLEHRMALKRHKGAEELEKLRIAFLDIAKTKTRLVDAIKLDMHIQSMLLHDVLNQTMKEFRIDVLHTSIKEKLNDLDSLVQSSYTMEMRERNIELQDQFVSIFDEMRLMQGTLEILEIFIIFVYFVYFATHIGDMLETLVTAPLFSSEELHALAVLIGYLLPGLLGVVFGVEYIRHGRSSVIKKHIRNIIARNGGVVSKERLVNHLVENVAHESELYIGVLEVALRPFERIGPIGPRVRRLRHDICTTGLTEEIEHILGHPESFLIEESDEGTWVRLAQDQVPEA